MMKFAIAGAAACLLAGAAFAQSGGAPSWTGPYAGVHVGYGFDDSSHPRFAGETPANQTALPVGALAQNRAGALGGAQLGYNYQTGMVVIGGEIDGSYLHERGLTDLASPDGRFTRLRSDLQWMGTARARVGVLASPRGMFYLTGGYAAGGVRGSAQFSNADTFFGRHSYTASGYVGGGGLEFRPFTQGRMSRISLRSEAMYYDLGRSHIFSYDLSEPHGGYVTTVKTRGLIGRFGINYAF